MTISKQLFLSVLAMDAYYREYGAPFVHQNNTELGSATITLGSALAGDHYDDWKSSSFYAVSYEIDGGGVDGLDVGDLILSYRGTDAIAVDFLTGWTIGAGFAWASQANYAVQAWEAVADHSIYDANGVKPIVTGHSLGGGLAGFASLLSGSEGVGFDHMPFGASAWLRFGGHVYNVLFQMMINGEASLTDAGKVTLEIVLTLLRPQLEQLIEDGIIDAVGGVIDEHTLLAALKSDLLDLLKPSITDMSGDIVSSLQPVLDAVTPDIIESWNIHIPDFEDFRGVALEGEALQYIRSGLIPEVIGNTIQWLATALAPFTGFAGPFVAALGTVVHAASEIISAGITWAEEQVDQSTISTNGWTNINPIDRHSISLLTVLQFGEEQSASSGREGWKQQSLNEQFLWALFDDTLATSAGALKTKLVGAPVGSTPDDMDASTLMSAALAYSVIDEGFKPFGDSGVRVLFDDLNDLGAIYANANHDDFLDKENFRITVRLSTNPVTFTITMGGVLARIATEYAGALALSGVEVSKVSDVDLHQGIIQIADDQRTFAVDLSKTMWDEVLRAGGSYEGDGVEVVDRGVLLSNYLEQSEELDADILSLSLPGGSLWLGGQVNEDALNELVGWGWGADDYTQALDRIHVRAVNGVSDLTLSERAYAVAGGTSNDAHVDVYVGTNEAERITGTRGNDFLLTADGDDEVRGGTGRDFIIAGKGNDRIIDELAAIDLDGNARNDNDLYIGDKVDANALKSFTEWLGELTGLWGDTDVVQYTVEDPDSPGSYAADGVTVTDLRLVAVGDLEAVAISVRDENTGLVGTDRLIEIQKVELTERGDRVSVTGDMLQTPIWIDMGTGPRGGTVGKDDYDNVSYAEAGKPIITVNGVTQTGNGHNGGLTDVGYLQLIGEIVGSAVGLPVPATPVFSAFIANDPLRVTGAERVELTPFDDVLWYGPINTFVGAVTGWPADDAYPHFGEIGGGAGNDVLVVRDARYVFAGESIDPGQPGGPVAASDLRLELTGGEGEDRVMVIGGTGAIAAGGAGRDFVFNWSHKGQLYGDGVDGTGGGEDVFWWSPGAFIMDAERHDRLQMFGIPLTGGWGVQDGETDIVVDWVMPFVRYGYTSAGQLIVSWGDPHGLSEEELLDTAMVVNNFQFGDASNQYMVSDLGTLGMTFRVYGHGDEISLWNAVWGMLMSQIQALMVFAKSLHWNASDDPLVLDLDGDGIETTQVDFGAYFDLDGDRFAQRTGWVGGDDGLLARDLDGDGHIGDIHELFGAPGVSGFSILAALDDNGDGVVDVSDVAFSTLLVWRDRDEDGITDAGELRTLAETGIVSLSTGSTPQNVTVANGNSFRAEGHFTWADGHTGRVTEVVFDTNTADTHYLGDGGAATWAPAVDSRGYGKLTQLSTAAANDFELRAVLATTASAMTVADIDALRAQARPVFEAWGNALAQSQELVPLLLDAGGQIVDRGVYVEDSNGGWWQLASGRPVLAADGSTIALPTLEALLAQAAAAGQHWQLEQAWSPAARPAEPDHREESPYLVIVEDGRAVVLDHGVWHSDAQGSWWTLASGRAITNAAGTVIDRPQLVDVLASAVPTQGAAWRTEDFVVQAEPFPFAKFAVYYKGGIVTDYAVQVTDAQGSFFVWANNLRLALDYQERNGEAGGFALRQYALDLDHLRDADNAVGSYVRAEVLTPGQVRFAAAAYGIAFSPDILVAQVDAGGMLHYDAPIDATLDFFDGLMEHYSFFSRAAAVHLAAQGGLADYFRGIRYDPQEDAWIVTTDRELAPMFEAIFEHAPAGRDPAAAYLEKWGDVLEVIYPDLHRHDGGPKSQAFVLQMVVAAYDNVPVDAEFLKVAEVFGVDEEKIILTKPGDTTVDGTRGADFFVLGEGDQLVRGGLGRDVYVVGANFGHDVIEDVEPMLMPRANDTLRFAHVKSTDVYAYKSGIDLVIQVLGTDDVLTVRGQFDGKWPGLFSGDYSPDTEMVEITFADGVSWRDLDIAWATSHPLDTDDLVQGTPAVDVLDGGRGNDILRGGRDSDLYLFDVGYGQDVVEDNNDNILQKHVDVVQFGAGLRASNLRFQRVGDADDLIISLVDDNGVATGDRLTLVNQFKSNNTLVFGVVWLDRIERFVFADGTFLAENDVMRLAVEQGKTDQEDAIFGFHYEDRLDGGLGNDYLSGNDLDDTYLFARGYGHDVIEDNLGDFLSSSYDTLQMMGNIRPGDVDLQREGNSLTITLAINGSDDRVTLLNEFQLTSTVLFGDYYFDNVDEVRFLDGTVWDMDAMARMLLDEARTAGDDVIYGFDRADELDGGAGNDRLEGGIYNDTYHFHRGYGNDVIYDASRDVLLAPGVDTLDLSDVAFDDIVISRDRENLIFTIRDTGESVTLERQYNRFSGQENAVERFHFSDQWVPYTDLNPEDVDLVGTSGDDVLWGTHFAETIDGLGGNDQLIGSSDGDTYRFDAGYGNDVVIDTQESRRWLNDDHVRFGAGITVDTVIFSKDGDDLLISLADRTDTLRIRGQFSSVLSGVEQFHFHDGTTWSISDVEELLQIAGGGRGDDIIHGLDDRENILDGRQGDDQLFGGRAADTYLFGVGYELDTITEVLNQNAMTGAIDRVVFGTLVDPSTLTVRRSGGDLLFTLAESGDELRIVNGLDLRLVEQFDFVDGTVWTLEDVKTAMLRGTDGDDQLVGFDDTADLLDGGRGSDELYGGLMDDVFRFGLGYGADAISDSGGVDRIEFGALITVDMLRLLADGDNLVIRFDDFDDSLVIRDVLGISDAAHRVEELHFADGYVLAFDALLQTLIDQQATAGDDIVTGFADRGDRLTGGAGADELVGLGGSDLYVIASGEGLDLVDDRGSSAGDRILFSDHAASAAQVRRAHPLRQDVVISFGDSGDEVIIKGGLETDSASAIEAIEFVDGTVWTIDDLRHRVLQDATTSGDDIVTGFTGADRLEGSHGDDTRYGLSGSDTYGFTRGDGRDLIRDEGTSASETDVLELNGYVPDDLRVVRPQPDRNDLLLVFASTDDEILLRDQYNTSAGRGVEQVRFGDGTVLTRAELVARISTGGTDSDDDITGSAGSDLLIGRGGADRLSGGDGSDVYEFRRGDGRDVIDENGAGDTDVVRILGYTPAEVQLSRALDASDTLVIHFISSSDEIRIVNTLDSDSADQVERIEFEDGIAWTIAQVKEKMVVPADALADNRLVGFDTADVMAGGLGRDTLIGGDGADTYVWRRNDDDDTIQDQGFGDIDVVRLQGIAPSEVRLSRSLDAADTLELRVVGAQGVLRVVNTLDSDNADQIERFQFDDGTVWSIADVTARLVQQQATAGADRISGFDGSDNIDGGSGDDQLSGGDGSDTFVWRRTDGNDTITEAGFGDTDTVRLIGMLPSEVRLQRMQGFDDVLELRVAGSTNVLRVINTLDSDSADQIERFQFDDGTVWTIADVKAKLTAQQSTVGADVIVGTDTDDVIDGGAGDDVLNGMDGSDTYVWRRNDGQDTIEDNGFGDTDTVRLIGISPAELQLAMSYGRSETLELCVAGDTGVLRLVHVLFSDSADQVERFQFDDGTVWTIADVKARLVAQQATTAGDHMNGFDGSDTLDGGQGDDLLSGGDGSDTYVWRPNQGFDTIDENGFGDTDVVRVTGVAVADVRLTRLLEDSNTLELRVAGQAGVLRIVNTLGGDSVDQVERVVFDNGTTWTIADVIARVGPVSSITVNGSNGADTINSTAANETLIGGNGNDSYVYERGDGNDIVEDNNTGGGNADRLVLRGIDPAAVSVGRWGSDAVLSLAESSLGAGDASRIVLRQSLEPYFDRGIERVEFDNGTVWTGATLRSMVIAAAQTAGDDIVNGFGTVDILQGGTGDDLLAGAAGNDSYIYTRGDGDDIIDESDNSGGTADRLVLHGVVSNDVRVERRGNDALLIIAESAPGAGDGGRVMLRASLDPYFDRGVERVEFDDGTVWTTATLRHQLIGQSQTSGSDRIDGFVTADTFEAGRGNDTVAGGDGNDTYIYSRGDGDDIVDEPGTGGGNTDRIVLHGVATSAVSVERFGNDVVLRIAESGPGAGDAGSLVLRSTADPYFDRGIERVEFDDGTVWTPDALRALLLAQAQTAGSDIVNGFVTADTFNPGTGDDLVYGGDGNDTYDYTRGDGNDVVDDTGTGGGTSDRVVLHGITPGAVTVVRSGNDAILRIAPSMGGANGAGQILIRQTLNPYFDRGIESVVFDDGTLWSQDDLRIQLLAAENSEDGTTISGFSGSDVIEGGGGADFMAGGDGNDSYIWYRGDGDDVIDDTGTSGGGADTLRLRGVNPEDVSLHQGEGSDLIVVVTPSTPMAGDGARIVLKQSASPYFERGIERISFDDGTLWTQASFIALALTSAATERDDVIVGSTLDDRIIGRGGNDLIHGGDGSDTYVFRPGDGRDTVDDNGDGDADVIEIRGRTVDQARFTRIEAGSNDLLIRFADSADTITVVNGLAGTASDSIESVRFVDATTGAVTTSLTLAQIGARLMLDASTEGADLITGTGGADTLTGSTGPDVLDGGEGNDVYIYHRGDGDDRIEDTGSSTGSTADELQLPDFTLADLLSMRRSPPAGLDLVLNFADGDRLILRESLSDAAAGVETVRFADGTVLTVPQLRALVLAAGATAGDETLWGFSGDDVLRGGGGDDELHGGDGSDTYRFSRGDGHDVIEDDGNGDTDRLEIAGYASTEVSVERLYKGDDGVVLRFAGGDDQLTLLNILGSSSEDGIEQIVFADGVVWTVDDVIAALDNDAPVAASDGFFNAVQGRPLTLLPADLLANDYDPNGDALRIVAVGNAQHGSVQLDAAGQVIFTAADDFVGATRFEYTVSDGHNGLATQTVFVRVRPPASATDDSGFTVAEDTLLSIRAERLLANDFDGDLMVVSQVLDAQHGTVSLSSTGDISFTPTHDYWGTASFRYVANTPDGGRAEAVVSIEVTPVNDAPLARNDAGFVTDEGAAFTIRSEQLLRNDVDADGDVLRITAVAGDAHVNASLDPFGHVLIEPLLDFFGAAQITYTVSDGHGGQATATATLTVRPVNDAPVLGADTLATDEDTPLLIAVADLLANDSDAEFDPLTVTRVFGGQGGQAELFPNGTILFRPEDNFFGEASFRYEVDDGQGGLTSQRVKVQVNPLNDAPDARNERYGDPGVDWLDTVEDQPLRISIPRLLANDVDPDSAFITLVTVSSALHGSVAIEGNEVVFTPDADYWGEASFSYLVRDKEGAVDDARVTLYVAPVSDAPPVAGDDEVTMYEDVTTVVPIADLLANDTDIDHDPLTVDWIRPFSHVDAGAMSLSRNEAGDLVITPTANRNGHFTLQYQVSDGADGVSTGTITVNIVAVNDAPQAVDDSAATSLDAPLVVRLSDLPLNDSDPDFDKVEEARAQLHVAGVDGPSVGSLWVYGNEFAVLEAPDGFSGDLSFHYMLADADGGSDDGRVLGHVAAQRAAVIDGSSRRDLLIGTSGGERLEGHDGADDLFGRAGNDVLAGGDDADRLDGGEGVDTADYASSNIGVRADLQARIGQGGHAQGDAYISIENLSGSGYNDQLYGDGGVNSLDGGSGHDLIDGRDGDDQLQGGSGRDTLVGGAGADMLDGGADEDTADYSDSASAVNVSLLSGEGHGGDAEGDHLVRVEDVMGTLLDDVLEGDAGDNRLSGGRGADWLVGGEGDDWLDGGRDGDRIEGGAGIDTVDYAASLSGVTVDLSGQAAGGGDAAGDSFTGIENVRGSFHADVLTGDAGDNRLEGGAGADRLVGGGGFDTASYGGSDRAVTVDLSTGKGLGGDAQGDVLQGIDALIGSAYNDDLRGDAGANTFTGGYGQDLLAGGAGSDDYRFGFDAGGDFVEEQGSGVDLDRVLLDSSVRISDVGLVRRGSDLVIHLERGPAFLTDSMTITGHFGGESTGIEQIVFGDGTVWDRNEIAARTRLTGFDALDDLISWADEDVAYPIAALRLLGNDSDDGGAGLSIVSVSNAVNASVELLADGSVRFIGAPDFNGDAYFDYVATDGSGRLSQATARVIVRPVNDAPVAHPEGPFFTDEDTVFRIPIADLLANDSDIDGDTLFISGFGPLLDANGDPIGGAGGGGFFSGTHGSAMFDLFGANVLFTPEVDYYGVAGFSYIISDGAGGTSVANVEVHVAGVNDAPRLHDDAFTTRQDQALSLTGGSLTINDTEVEGDPMTVVRVYAAQHGSVTLDAGGQVVFTPEAGFLGTASFRYDAADDRGGVGTGGFVEVRVIPLNDPPHAGDDRFDAVEDTPLVIDPASLLANDSDPNGDPLTISRLDPYPENGSVAFDGQGRVVFTPRANYNGDASFYYWVSDGRGEEARGTVTISISPDNDSPYVNDDGVFHAIEDTPLLIRAAELMANDGDPDGDVLHFVGAQADHGSFTITPDGLVFTPEHDFVGTVMARYRVGDDKGGVSPTWANFTIEVSGAGDLPTAETDYYNLRQDSELVLRPEALLANDSDGDGQSIRFVGIVPDSARHGTVAMQADGSIRLVPEAGYVGQASFNYIITDDVDGSATGEVRITLTSDNSSPVANLDRFSGTEDTPLIVDVAALLANDVDADGDPLTLLSIDSEGDNGLATLLPGGRVAFTPDADFNGTVHFGYTISDGHGGQANGQIEIDVAPVNDGPDAHDDTGFVVQEDQTLDIEAAELLANDHDVEGDPFELIGIEDEINGKVTVNGSTLSFTPTVGFFGGAGFTYVVRDVHGATGRAQVSVQVAPANHPPVAMPDTGFAFDEDGFIDIDPAVLLANDYDADGDTFSLSWVGDATGGSVLQLANGLIRFTGSRDFNGDAGFSYRITDSAGRSGSARVAIDVRPVNDPPVAAADRASTVEDQPLVLPVLSLTANDHDPDGGSFQLVSVQGAQHGSVAMDGLGNVIFAPEANFSGEASFRYTIADLTGATSDGTVIIDVTPVNDAPTPQSDGPFTLARDDRLVIDPKSLLSNDTDVDGDALLVQAAEGAIHGSLTRDAAGRFVYIPDDGYVGGDTFRYTVSDGQLSREATVQLQVNDPYIGWRQGTVGDDVIQGASLIENSIYGATGDDRITGGVRGDRLEGGRGDDMLNGLNGDDKLGGGDGDDSLLGAAGNDRLTGGRGDDYLNGGWGDDVFVFARGDGKDVVTDFTASGSAGNDRIELHIPGIAGFNDVMQYAHQAGNGVLFEFGDGDSLLVWGATLPGVHQDWFSFTGPT